MFNVQQMIKFVCYTYAATTGRTTALRQVCLSITMHEMSVFTVRVEKR